MTNHAENVIPLSPRHCSDRGLIVAVSCSEGVGTAKAPVREALFITGRGIESDGHADTGRKVSLLQAEHVEAFNAVHGHRAGPGDFAENVLTSGIDLSRLQPGDRLCIAEAAVLEVVQVGKEVLQHHYSFHGFRLLPTLGVFCRVIEGGRVAAGATISIFTKVKR